MKPLKHPLPKGRTVEQVWEHYRVESEIAHRLMTATKEQRRQLLSTMYDELFERVPDHPRLTRRVDPTMTEEANRASLLMFGRFASQQSVVVEFAPGDCEFAAVLASRVKKVYGVDISDQRATGRTWPENFELIVYDGERLPGVSCGTVDVVMSNQFIEHLHPEDVVDHVNLVRDLLRVDGCYVLCTPHAATGPWGVSRYFSDRPEGFHLKEWTYAELEALLRASGFRRIEGFWTKKGMVVRVPIWLYRASERLLNVLPRPVARSVAKYLTPVVYLAAYK